MQRQNIDQKQRNAAINSCAGKKGKRKTLILADVAYLKEGGYRPKGDVLPYYPPPKKLR